MAQLAITTHAERSRATQRPAVRGKFLYVGEEKFWVKGVSYGTFAQDEKGEEQLLPEVVERDFAQIAENGFNVVRTYTVPPRWLLDTALRKGLRVMVGIPVEVPMVLIDEPGKPEEIGAWVRTRLRTCAGHPAVFCYTIGNEVAPSVVRWHGRRRIQRFLHRLYLLAKEEDPDALVTYVNFPTTEYLELPFLDFLCFNVYLETQGPLREYIARLHNLSDDRPLLLAEVGLDSLRNGEEKQAETLDWQVRTAFRSGCCGVVIYSWTDEWYRWGDLVKDWNFGLTTRDRNPKPALQAVRKALDESPFPKSTLWPKVSVVVCSHNGALTIRETLDGLLQLDYPAFEVIVVNDGSTDATSQIAAEYPFKLINTENQGLSQARNTGVEVADGEIIAFIDDDAYPDIHWLRFLALCFMEDEYVGVGGPNLPPLGDGWKATAISNAPGPNPVLLSDKLAEHIPGCNMALRKDALREVGGFDPIFRAAGDDVDICWRLQERGGLIGFTPAAVVWHHRRNTFYKYWRQQQGYGKAEAMLERKWPGKYDVLGQMRWAGRIYGRGFLRDLSFLRGRVYQGVWGSASFQSLYQSSNSLWSLALAPEWYLAIGLLALMLLLSFNFISTIILGFFLAAGIGLPTAEAVMNAQRARFGPAGRSGLLQRLRFRISVFFLLLMQPLARLSGRLNAGLTPWRRHGMKTGQRLLPLTMRLWRSDWREPDDELRNLRAQLQDSGAIVGVGGEYDRWDLQVQGGLLGGSRLCLAMQSFGSGKQLFRYRVTPKYSWLAVVLSAPFVIISTAAWLSGSWVQCALAGLIAVLVVIRAVDDAGFATGTIRDVLKRSGAL